MPRSSSGHSPGADIAAAASTEPAPARPWALDERLSAPALELRLFLERFVAEHRDEPLAWVCVPFLCQLETAIHAERLGPIGRLPGPRARLGERRRAWRLAGGPAPHDAHHWLAAAFLFEADGANHRRALEPIMRRLGEPRPLAGEIRPEAARTRALARRALKLAGQLLRSARDSGLSMHADPTEVTRRLVGGAHYLAYSEALLAALEPRAVVVASTVNLPPRSLALAARGAGVPSVFVPHAPLITDLSYVELTTDRAALRGSLEAELYARLAGSSERIDVIGDPGLSDLEPPAHDPRLPPVLAPPPLREWLDGFVEIVAGAGLDELLVAPHPRADLAELRAAIPAGWEIWERASYEALGEGPPALIHYSSGLALEALLLGIPTIDVRRPGSSPTGYAFACEPFAYVVSGSEELRAALARASEDVCSPGRRADLRAWAQRWCSHTAKIATERGERAVRAASDGPLEPIWTAWSAPLTTR